MDDLNKINGNKYIYSETSKKELKKMGIDVSNIEADKNGLMVYSLGYKITDIWYSKYAPDDLYADGTGPILVDTDYVKDKPHAMHIYIVYHYFGIDEYQ